MPSPKGWNSRTLLRSEELKFVSNIVGWIVEKENGFVSQFLLKSEEKSLQNILYVDAGKLTLGTDCIWYTTVNVLLNIQSIGNMK